MLLFHIPISCSSSRHCNRFLFHQIWYTPYYWIHYIPLFLIPQSSLQPPYAYPTSYPFLTSIPLPPFLNPSLIPILRTFSSPYLPPPPYFLPSSLFSPLLPTFSSHSYFLLSSLLSPLLPIFSTPYFLPTLFLRYLAFSEPSRKIFTKGFKLKIRLL